MSPTISTLLFLFCAYSLHAQIAGESTAVAAGDPPMKMPDEEVIRVIKQQPLHSQFEIHYFQSISQGDLRRVFELLEAPPVGYGFGAEYSYYFDPVPVSVGGELGVLFNGAESKTLRANDFFRTRFEVSASNTQVPVLFHIRFQPNINSWLFPYAEGVGGFTLFSSVVTIDEIQGVDTTTNHEGDGYVSWNYGLGAGVAIKISDVITLPNSLQRTLFDVRIRYLWGTPTTIPNAVLDGGNSVGYSIIGEPVGDPRVVTFRAGFVFQF
jgi:hypothetical protein